MKNRPFRGAAIRKHGKPGKINSPLAKLGKSVKIAEAGHQRKAKSETVSAVAIAFREDTKSFDKSDSVFNKDTLHSAAMVRMFTVQASRLPQQNFR